MRQLVNSLCDDNNLVPFHLWWIEVVLKCEKVYKCFAKDSNSGLYVIIMPRTSFRVNLYSIVCLNVKELLARCRRYTWTLSYCNEIRTHHHLVRKRTLKDLVYELSGCGFKSRWSHIVILGWRSRDWFTLENQRYLNSSVNVPIVLSGKARTFFKTKYESHQKYIILYHSYQKNVTFTGTRRYYTKFHNPNKRKMELPCSE